MKGIGIDLVEIQRIAKATQRSGFVERIYTPQERQLAEGHRERRQLEFWAGRFAAKEAVAKALGVGFGSALAPQQIQITVDSLGAPKVELLGEAQVLARRGSISQILVSITHTKDFAMAIAVATEKRDPDETGNS